MTFTSARVRLRSRRTIGALLAAIVLPIVALVAAAPALAGGSDSPTPYTVGADALTLPAGSAFQDNGHVNVRYTVAGSSQEQSLNVHFEGKCQTRTDAECAGTRHVHAQLIGTSTMSWDTVGIPADACITWVQLSQYNEHFGEGGQAPVCRTTPSEPTPSEPTPSEPTPSEPTPSEPTPSEPTPSEPTPSEPTPSEPTPSTPPVTEVVHPEIQDYLAACDAAFVLDNSSSTVPVTYTVNGVDYVVAAGSAIHTDADGTRIAPIDGQYVITTDTGREWTFAERSCIVEPQIQDYVAACDAAFVLDNTSSTVPVTYTVNGVDYVVAAGSAIHTDADGTRIAPIDGQYVITTDTGREWTFAASTCVVTPPTTPAEPTPSEPTPSEPTPSEPTPSEPTPSEPTPSEPTPSEPTPSEPTPSEPTPSEPTPSEPTPSEPTPSDPGTDVPAIEEPVPPSETPAEPTPSDPTPSTDPVPATDTPTSDAPAAAGAAPAPSATPTASGSSLPVTGATPLLLVALLGGMLMAGGLVARRTAFARQR